MRCKATVLAALLAVTSVGTAAALEKVVVQSGSPVPAAAYLDYYVAQKAGFFADDGIDVEFRYAQGAPQATQIVASGGAPIGAISFEPYLHGYASGMRGKFYFNYNHYNIFFMAVPEESDIKTIADLKGKKIGVTNMGSGSLIVARSMLRDAKLDSDNSVFLPVGVGDSAVQALRSGKVQALSLWDGGYAALERAGVKLRYLHHPRIGFVGNVGVFLSDKATKETRENAIRVLRGLVKARVFIRENLDAALNIYWQTNPGAKQGATEEEARAKGLIELKFMSPSLVDVPVDKIGRYDMEDIGRYLAVMKEEGVLTADLRPEDLVSNELIDAMGKIDPEPVRDRARKWK